MSTGRTPSVIFDLDGTLVDSEPNYFEAGRRVLAAHGVLGFGWEEHTRFIGIGTRETLEILRARYAIDAPLDELLAAKNSAYLELASTSTEVFPQMRAFVQRLSEEGVPMAVASGSSRAAIEAVLAGTGLAPYMSVTVSAEEVGRGKPEPDVFLEAARRLDAAPGDCVVLEDAPPGAAAARAAGMRCIAVPYVEDTAGDTAFLAADLLFPGGQREFTAAAAYGWLTGAV
ncbi:HAD family hydrolase [Streptomyces xantholiticus]|uniref:HAD family hydrolase n=1 Tax=Streptomyces xantholiticus TaxID=68285 RepID=UPI0016725964|nr:HAD family phosphatase [Streptomyces xantholiticus]GGW37235.1 hydrolase [Streptomyces xantholiticus]